MQTQSRRTSRKARRRLILIGGLLAASNLAQAHYFCVATAQQFQNALNQSSDGGVYNAEDNDIYMVGGTYRTGTATSNGPFLFYSPNSVHKISVNGGYAAGCGAPIASTPATTLDGGGHTGVLAIRNKYGDILLRNFTVQNGESSEPGAGLQVNYQIPVGASADIRDIIIRNNHSTGTSGGLYVVAAGEKLFLISNLITDNTADEQFGAGTVIGFGTYNAIVNNTVTKNFSFSSSTPIGGIYCSGATGCWVFNNIFWNNNNYGLYLAGSNAVLRHNDYGSLGGTAPAIDEMNMSIAPKFVDIVNNDFHLAGDSPLLGRGVPFSGESDLDGHPFPLNGKRDLGAYSETIFVDGLDGD